MTVPGNRTACPQCGASVRLDAAFCGQCYADFRPPPPPPSAPVAPTPTASYGVPAPDPLTAPLLDVVLPPSSPAGLVPAQGAVPAAAASEPAAPAKPTKPTGWPCSRCDALNDFEAPLCGTCGSSFLAQVSDETKLSIVLPVVGDLGRYSRGQRAGIALGAIIVLLIPVALLTLLLSGKPPASPTPSTSDTVTTTTDSTGQTAPSDGSSQPTN